MEVTREEVNRDFGDFRGAPPLSIRKWIPEKTSALQGDRSVSGARAPLPQTPERIHLVLQAQDAAF